MFEECGASVFQTHLVGRSFPDLVIGYQGVTFLVEIKRPNADLKEGQVKFHDNWKGSKPFVVRTLDDVVSVLNNVQIRNVDV
jgi:hypothetical protein